jgi:hypothetical protein
MKISIQLEDTDKIEAGVSWVSRDGFTTKWMSTDDVGEKLQTLLRGNNVVLSLIPTETKRHWWRRVFNR